jgi:hypothetical protein
MPTTLEIATQKFQPLQPLSADLIICEKLLTEGDGAMSAIRMVDVFFVPPLDQAPPNVGVPMCVLATIKTSPEDIAEHSLELRLVRPSGATVTIGERFQGPPNTKFKDGLRAYNLIAQIGVIPKELGIHYFTLLYDDKEMRREPFTLRPLSEQA